MTSDQKKTAIGEADAMTEGFRPHVVGLVGGVGSGKSFVTRELENLGAFVIDGDALGHEVLRLSEVKQEIQARWGEDVFDAEGDVNRRELARIVFAKNAEGFQELNYLERITHPRIAHKIKERLEEAQKNRIRAVVLDAAVMFKAGWNRFCDTILFVEASQVSREERAARRKWSPQDLHAREQSQEPLEWKRQNADAVIDNSGTMEDTRRQVREFWDRLTASLPSNL